MEKRQRTRLASAVVLAVVFVSGGLVGMAADRALRSAPAADAATVSEPSGRDDAPTSDRPSQSQTFIYEQVLSAEQIAVADSIVRVYEQARDELRRGFRRASDSILDASGRPQQYQRDLRTMTEGLRANVRALMAPDQLSTYDSLIAAEEARRAEQRQQRQRERPDSAGNSPR